MTKRLLAWAEIMLIIFIALAPLTGTFPYRQNIFLSYEGAYRLYIGQVPYRDFGMPLGFMYWVVPLISFKLFGPALISLVKGQVFLNILAGVSFLSILRSLSVQPTIRFLSLLVFIFSYSFINYWPWYNHTVIVYELLALAFLMKFFFGASPRYAALWLIVAAFFTCCSFFTKQDGGGLALLICISLLVTEFYFSRSFKGLLIFIAAILVIGAAFILPFVPYGFGYWFNHGQPPHNARVSLYDFVAEFFNASQWLKFYFLAVLITIIVFLRKHVPVTRRQAIFTALVIGILVEATILQVTSYVPPDNNIFFHSFAFAFLLSAIAASLNFDVNHWKIAVLCSVGIMLWWSGNYWRYVDKYAKKVFAYKPPAAGVVNKNTYLIATPDSTDVPMNEWREVNLPSFRHILLPGPTVDGINRLVVDSIWKRSSVKVLNMSELTPLAHDIPFALETGSYYPLWFHKGVGMFDQQAEFFKERIRQHYYDIVIFEYIPYLNNFYPFEVRDELKKYYRRTDVFTAPRKPSNQAWVEIYKP